MKNELWHIVIAILVLTIVVSFSNILNGEISFIPAALLISFITIAVNIGAKKLTASIYNSGVEHEIWSWSRFGLRTHWHLKKDIPMGVILPLVLTAISTGMLKVMALLTYDTKAPPSRTPKKGSFYSFTEVTEWENGLIGASGIFATLLLSFISYWIPVSGFEVLFETAAFYAFFNILPVSKLDGTQIFFGSRVMWTALALISIVMAGYAVILM